MSDVVDLARRLVTIPSVSGEEGRAVEFLAGYLAHAGAEVHVVGRNLWSRRGDAGWGLLLNTHIDTVPVGEGWTVDPFAGQVRDGRLIGRGSADAKGQVACMTRAFLDVDGEALAGGSLVLAVTCDEETGGEGLETLVGSLPRFDAAIIGEPTGLAVCPGQRGMMKLKVTAAGRMAHASRPWQGVNAIERAARALVALDGLDLTEEDPALGRATVTPVLVEGGLARNVVPPACSFVLDCRTIPQLDNQGLRRRIEAVVGGCRVEALSERFHPVTTPDGETIVQAALRAAPGGIGRFYGVSDLYHVRDVPGVILGPGENAQSHAPDESIALADLEAGVAAQVRTIREFFQGVGR